MILTKDFAAGSLSIIDCKNKQEFAKALVVASQKKNSGELIFNEFNLLEIKKRMYALN